MRDRREIIIKKAPAQQDTTLKRDGERAMIKRGDLRAVGFQKTVEPERERESIYAPEAGNAGSALCGVINLRECQRWQTLNSSIRFFCFSLANQPPATKITGSG